jgi:hypothetical protein
MATIYEHNFGLWEIDGQGEKAFLSTSSGRASRQLASAASAAYCSRHPKRFALPASPRSNSAHLRQRVGIVTPGQKPLRPMTLTDPQGGPAAHRVPGNPTWLIRWRQRPQRMKPGAQYCNFFRVRLRTTGRSPRKGSRRSSSASRTCALVTTWISFLKLSVRPPIGHFSPLVSHVAISASYRVAAFA